MFDSWILKTPIAPPDWHQDSMGILKDWCEEGDKILALLPPNTEWQKEHRDIVLQYRDAISSTRAAWIAKHGEPIYKILTNNFREYLRVDELIIRAANDFPGLLPTNKQLVEDASSKLKDRIGHEISVGLVLSQWLAISMVGKHMMAAMRLPTSSALALLSSFQTSNEIDLGIVHLEKRGRQAHITLRNIEFLNAEDDALLTAMECAVDIALLDPNVDLGVIRGGFMSHDKYRDRRVFCSGINLKKLYAGELSFLFYVSRELGLVNKLLRGLWQIGSPWTDAPGVSEEKPWVAAVDGHAIGGGCQLLLVCDHVIAESNAFISIPARSEGFIPGIANLRLLQYVGRRLANRMIYRNHKIKVDSDEGRLLVDEVVDSKNMESAIHSIINEIIDHGIKGIISNRKAFRYAVEPLDQFQYYVAMFCREQVLCMYGTEIIQNLERFLARPR